MNLFKGISGVITVAIIAFISILSTKSYALSLILTAVQYITVYYCIAARKFFNAFVFFLIFTSTAIEMDFYVYSSGVAPFNRLSFFNPYLAYKFTACLIFLLVYSKYHVLLKNALNNKILKRFVRWIVILLTTGFLSVLIGIVLGDNITTGVTVFNKLLSTLVVYSVILTGLIFVASEEKREELKHITVIILAGVTLAGLISIIVGFNGYYGDKYETMLASMLVGFSPCLISFVREANPTEKSLYLFLYVAIIIAAFSSPSVIGSKWYIVIASSLIFFIYKLVPNVNPIYFVLLFIILLLLIPIIGEFLFDLMSTDAFNKWKFEQAMKALDVFSYGSIEAWFLDLDNSARFRIDEPINIAIEYMNKPLYFLFGKGIGGTTQHYTFFCDWSGLSAFTDDQVKSGYYYDMHETLAVLFLQHGLLGVVFFFDTLIVSLKQMKKSSFSIMGILWFFFYWSFGLSFMIGIIALLLTLSEPLENKHKSKLKAKARYHAI